MATVSCADDVEMTLEELVTTNPLPQLAKVTVGWQDPHNSSSSFSTGDVIEVCVLIISRDVKNVQIIMSKR